MRQGINPFIMEVLAYIEKHHNVDQPTTLAYLIRTKIVQNNLLSDKGLVLLTDCRNGTLYRR